MRLICGYMNMSVVSSWRNKRVSRVDGKRLAYFNGYFSSPAAFSENFVLFFCSPSTGVFFCLKIYTIFARGKFSAKVFRTIFTISAGCFKIFEDAIYLRLIILINVEASVFVTFLRLLLQSQNLARVEN